MEITLTPEIEELLIEEMKTGDYISKTDVLREGLLLLKSKKLSREERIENLKREINKGAEDIKNGNYREYNSANEMIEDILNEVHSEFEINKK